MTKAPAYIKSVEGVAPDHRERANEIGRPLTPRSERPRNTWGSLQVGLNIEGLCGNPRLGKGACWRKANHEGECI